MNSVTDWRRKDYYGQIIREEVKFALNHEGVLETGKRIFNWIAERENVTCSIDIFANFVSYLVRLKVESKLGKLNFVKFLYRDCALLVRS